MTTSAYIVVAWWILGAVGLIAYALGPRRPARRADPARIAQLERELGFTDKTEWDDFDKEWVTPDEWRRRRGIRAEAAERERAAASERARRAREAIARRHTIERAQTTMQDCTDQSCMHEHVVTRGVGGYLRICLPSPQTQLEASARGGLWQSASWERPATRTDGEGMDTTGERR